MIHKESKQLADRPLPHRRQRQRSHDSTERHADSRHGNCQTSCRIPRTRFTTSTWKVRFGKPTSHTLAVKQLFKKPVPGWHSKGGYTSQGRLVISNNGELHVGNYDDVLVGGEAKNDEERGVLAEWNGSQWRIVERRQYTEVTGPPGIAGGSDGQDPIWSMGWDRRSVRLKLLEDGQVAHLSASQSRLLQRRQSWMVHRMASYP